MCLYMYVLYFVIVSVLPSLRRYKSTMLMIVIVICLIFYRQDCARDKRQYLDRSELHFGISAPQ